MRILFVLIFLAGIPLSAGPASEVRICARECTGGSCQDGKGVQVYENCDRYKGEFSRGLRHGKGEYIFVNGDSYAGEFRSGRRAGRGIYEFKTGGKKFESVMDEAGNGTGRLQIGSQEHECKIMRFSASCGNAAELTLSEKMEPIGIVLYAGSDSAVERAGRRRDIKSGDPVLSGDRLESGRDNLDLQFEGKVGVRLKPQSGMSVTRSQENQTVDLKKGELIVKFERKTGGIAIQAPAAQVEADGSTLSVRTSPESTEVKVFEMREGRVEVSPAFPELRGKSREEIESDPRLKSLEEKRRTMTRPLEPKTSVTQAPLEKSEQAAAPQPRPFVPSQREAMETRALVTVDESLAQKAAQSDNAAARKAVQDSVEANAKVTILELEKELSRRVIESDRDLIKEYDIVENIVLRSGGSVRGATVTQSGNILLVHGIRRTLQIRTTEIIYIDYIRKEELK